MDSAYYIVESGEVLIAAEKYREDLIKYRINVNEWARSVGAIGWQTGFNGKVFSLKFPKDSAPSGFKKPNKHGCRTPYAKNSEWLDKINNAPVEPNPDEYFKDVIKCPCSLSYEYEGGKGSYRMGGFYHNIYNPAWFSAESPICIIMPDVEGEVKRFYKDKEENGYKNPVITNGVDSYKVPDGMRKILKEEWDLMVALEKQKDAA